MNFYKTIKSLLKKGWATKAEKDALKKEVEAQDADTQEAVAEDVAEVEALPEENPADVKEEEEAVEELEKSIKSIITKEIGGVRADVQKILDEHKAKLEKGVGVYREDIKADRAYKSEKMKELVSSVLAGDFTPRYKEMTTGTGSSPYAGYVTDDELSAEIRHLQTEYGVSAREMFTVTVSKASYKANNLVTDVSTYWIDEAGSFLSTQGVFGQGTLDVKKLGAIVTLTRELLQESEIDLISFLGERVAEGFAYAEDLAFFNGDGTSTYGSFTGLLQNTSVNEVTMTGSTFASLTVKDLRDMQDATPQGALANAKYYMHRSVLSIVRNLREDAVTASDGAGAYLYKSPTSSEPANIDGYPIVLVEVMPKTSSADTSFVLFGDLKKACLRGVRGGIEAKRFDAGTVRNVANDGDINLITTDREAVRWVSQVGYLAIVPTAVTKLTTATASA